MNNAISAANLYSLEKSAFVILLWRLDEQLRTELMIRNAHVPLQINRKKKSLYQKLLINSKVHTGVRQTKKTDTFKGTLVKSFNLFNDVNKNNSKVYTVSMCKVFIELGWTQQMKKLYASL